MKGALAGKLHNKPIICWRLFTVLITVCCSHWDLDILNRWRPLQVIQTVCQRQRLSVKGRNFLWQIHSVYYRYKLYLTDTDCLWCFFVSFWINFYLCTLTDKSWPENHDQKLLSLLSGFFKWWPSDKNLLEKYFSFISMG